MIANLYSFLKDYFLYYNCSVSEDNETEMTIQLTKELDQVLMNRPFYWHYMDKIGQVGQPMSLQLNIGIDKKDKKETIHFGSPRLQQIFRHITENARYTLLYERTNEPENKALYPWLVVNMMIHYSGKQKKEVLYSFGLHLINGTIRLNMMDDLESVKLDQIMPDYTYTISPLIKPISGFNRLFQYVQMQLQQEDKQWVKHSDKALKEELTLLKYFYQHKEDEESDTLYKKEEERIIERLEPHIEAEVINAGIFYLSENTSIAFSKNK